MVQKLGIAAFLGIVLWMSLGAFNSEKTAIHNYQAAEQAAMNVQ